jgi:hypothetical protein
MSPAKGCAAVRSTKTIEPPSRGTPHPSRRGWRWKTEIAEKLKAIYKSAAPAVGGIVGTPFAIFTQNRTRINPGKAIADAYKYSSRDGRMPIVIGASPAFPAGFVIITVDDFIGLALACGKMTFEQSLEIPMELRSLLERTKHCFEPTVEQIEIDHSPRVLDYMYDSYNKKFKHRWLNRDRVRTVHEVARDLELDDEQARTALEALVEAGKIKHARTSVGRGYIALTRQEQEELQNGSSTP